MLVVVDSQGKVLASLGAHPVPNVAAMQTRLPRQAISHLQKALSLPVGDFVDPTRQTSAEANETLISVMPVFKDNDAVVGAVILMAYHPQISQDFFTSILPDRLYRSHPDFQWFLWDTLWLFRGEDLYETLPSPLGDCR